MDEQQNVTVTTQLTSKRLKFHKLVSWFFIALGMILILEGTGEDQDKHSIAWGCLFALYGFGHLAVTRVRIWWNHK